MATFFDLFSGGGGAAQGATQAGLTPIGGVEIDPAIAAIYTANHGDHLTIANVLRTKPKHYDRPDWLHASPVCKNFSTAKANAAESTLDILCAKKVAEYIGRWRPHYFSLENVGRYGGSAAFNIIVNALYSAGYFPQWDILNAADYGVPQSRRRLILVAVKGGFATLPAPTVKQHRGWYEAIADLIPGLPDSKLADWQIKALPEWVRGSLLVHPTDQRTCPTPEGSAPAFTVTASMPSTGNYPRALLIPPGNQSFSIKAKNEPSFTLGASALSEHKVRALLIENTGARSDRPLQIRTADQPCWTIRAMGADGHWHRATALEQGRVVALTIPALARLQSFPDSYQWSGRNATDGMAIGNSVPPLLMEAVIRHVMEATS